MAEFKNRDEGRVIMWCVPRSASTALAKCMSAIEENIVWFEPYTYAHGLMKGYHSKTQQELPMEYEGNEDIYAEAVKINQELMPNNNDSKLYPERLSYANIKRDLQAATSRYVFVKEMGFAINKHRTYLPTGFKHTFLIHEPSRVFVSFRNSMSKELRQYGLISNESTFDIITDDLFDMKPYNLFKDLHEFWNYVREKIDPNPIIIDTYDLLSKPHQTLMAYCKAVGLPYSDSLLKWNPSVDEGKGWRTPGEGVLTEMKNFYGTAVDSTHFMDPGESGAIPRDQLTDDVVRCVVESMPYYTEMYQHRLQA